LEISFILIVLIGSAIGCILRIFIQDNFKIKVGFDIQSNSIVNFIASFFLGILIALNITNKDLFFVFCTAFLGCFSTFSSFIYQLFILLKKRQFIRLFFHYLEVMIFSFVSFYAGYFLMQFF